MMQPQPPCNDDMATQPLHGDNDMATQTLRDDDNVGTVPVRRQGRNHNLTWCNDYLVPEPLRDGDDAAHSPPRHRRARFPQNPRADDMATEPVENVGAVPPCGDDAPAEPDDVGTAFSRDDNNADPEPLGYDDHMRTGPPLDDDHARQ